jgi:site-specific recombinase XerD
MERRVPADYQREQQIRHGGSFFYRRFGHMPTTRSNSSSAAYRELALSSEHQMPTSPCPRMVRRRTAEAGFKVKLGCHVFRATGITAYLEAGGTLENAQAMAAHESPRTTKLYDRTGDEITLDEVERITI